MRKIIFAGTLWLRQCYGSKANKLSEAELYDVT
jgi:hypothetical protein